MLQNKTIGFIGSGNMAMALVSGLIGSGLAKPQHLYCSDVSAERLLTLEKTHGVRTSQDNRSVIQDADIVIFAVKPQVLGTVAKEAITAIDRSKLVISIAAGVPLATFTALTDEPLRLIRAMPNVCVSVKEGATAITAGTHAGAEDLALAKTIFESVGRCMVIGAEHLLDAVTGLSGSGPAYVFMMIDALADAGVNVGLPRAEALLLATQTLMGAARMQLESNLHPAQLKDMVTSPGGTTIAGLHALEKGGLRGLLMDAVQAATNRSKALGKVG
jgi:pyrroline-5-carboxylate reductase